MGKRNESLGVIISTQATNDQHPLSQMIDDAALDEDPSVYLQLASAPIDADIFDEKVWFACNEALGKFLDLNEFRAQATQAKRLPSFRARFENLRLNKRIDANVQFMLPFFWLPEEGLLERDRKEQGHYRAWRDAGLLEVTAGRAINFKAIIRRLAEINAEYDLVRVAYDRAFIKTFSTQCAEEGITLPLEEYGQGYVSMSPAVQALEAAVLDRRIHHGGHPILRWQISNVAITVDPAGNRKPDKKRAIGHIDGVISLLMALGAASRPVPKIDIESLIG